jgi:two-component system cell cycle response regulator
MSEVKEELPPPERRKLHRRRILKGARIAFAGHHTSTPCAVRDLTEEGARMRLQDEAALVPAKFELAIEIDGTEAQCEVVWRKRGDLGVKFHSVRQTVPLRRQVITLAGRPVAPT